MFQSNYLVFKKHEKFYIVNIAHNLRGVENCRKPPQRIKRQTTSTIDCDRNSREMELNNFSGTANVLET